MTLEEAALSIALLSLVVSLISLNRTRTTDESALKERISSKRTQYIAESKDLLLKAQQEAAARTELMSEAERFVENIDSEAMKKYFRMHLDPLRLLSLYVDIEYARFHGYHDRMADYSSSVTFVELEEAIGSLRRYGATSDEWKKIYDEMKKVFDEHRHT